MNNTEKKLDALIDALRFDVEETKTFDSDDVIKWSNRWKTLEGLGVSFVPPDRPKPTVKYKFTKRDELVDYDPQENANRPTNSPPIGLAPKYIHDELREGEIISAMIRYLNTGKPIPPDWTGELRDLQVARS
tara:strand:- start:3517 stop:3912 length:396 start_codon:yes stop_codon:yes gene_type:complete